MNTDPILRAWRLERRRKELGSDHPRCFYCLEADIPCLEVEHPVTKELDPNFRRAVCFNCHRKWELKRDLAHLTKNGRRGVRESARAKNRRYLRLFAADLECIAEVVLSAHADPELIAAALRAGAASLRRKAVKL